MKKHNHIPFAILSSLVLATEVACTSFNNPFHPWAELRITEVKAVAQQGGDQQSSGALIGIRQSSTTVDGNPTILYTYTEPALTIENKPALPRVHFYKFQVEYRLSDGTTLPMKEYPMDTTLPISGTATIPFNIMGIDTDLRSVVYPGNRAPRVTDGLAMLKLFGKDMNGYETTLSTTIPLRFETVIFSENSEIPVPIPSAAASASPSATPSPQLNF